MEWIKISDRLPEKNNTQNILFYDMNDGVVFGWYDFDGWQDDTDYYYKVVLWMYIPEMPEL